MKDPRHVYVRYDSGGKILGVEAIPSEAPKTLAISTQPDTVDQAALAEVDSRLYRDPVALLEGFHVIDGKLAEKAPKKRKP